MALEAWAHRRVEEGDPVDQVVAQIVGDPAMSSAVLLVAVDVLLSHGAPSIEAAVPLVACPELLCMDRLRPHHDNMRFPDFFGLQALQHEPTGPANIQSLRERPSRKFSLYDVLCRLTFGPGEVVNRVRELLSRAASRLGPPGADSDLGDPGMMAVHALNILNRENWIEVTYMDSAGQEQRGLQYRSPEEEQKQLELIQKKASPRLEESKLRLEILNAVCARQPSTSEFLTRAFAWAERHVCVLEQRPEFDWNGEHGAITEAVVSAAMLVARDGTSEQIAQCGSRMREVFVRAHEGDSDPVYLERSGLRFNPRAIAFVGQVLLLERHPQEGDVKRLLEFASTTGYASAHGLTEVVLKLEQMNELLVPAILRCAFTASIYLDEPWRISEEDRAKNRTGNQARIARRIEEELAWLAAPNSEPEWPQFPLQKIRHNSHRIGEKRDYATEAAEYNSVKLRVNYHQAALWLQQIRPFDPVKRPWLGGLLLAYAEWTRLANGWGEEKEEHYDGQPDKWDDSYFDLSAQFASGLSEEALYQSLQDLFGELPDESLCDCLPLYLKSADRAFFEESTLSVEQLLQIRTFLIRQLSGTRVFGWNKDREEGSAEMHLAHALAALCFNDHYGFAPSKCYLPPTLISRADPFLPLLESLVGEYRSPFLASMYLNFIEVAPHAKQLSFIVGCTEKWLERFPESYQFWIEWDFGRRLSAVMITIFHESPKAFEVDGIRNRLDKTLVHLVGLGVSQAHDMEKLLYQISE